MQTTGHSKPEFQNDSKHNQHNQPVVRISWHDATAYAKWMGKTGGKRIRMGLPDGLEKQRVYFDDSIDWWMKDFQVFSNQ